MTVKVTPWHKRGYSAPYFVISFDEKEKTPISKAIDEVKKITRLSDFLSWNFQAEIL